VRKRSASTGYPASGEIDSRLRPPGRGASNSFKLAIATLGVILSRATNSAQREHDESPLTVKCKRNRVAVDAPVFVNALGFRLVDDPTGSTIKRRALITPAVMYRVRRVRAKKFERTQVLLVP